MSGLVTDQLPVTNREMDEVRPAMRCNSVFLEIEGGVFLRNGDTAFVIRGNHVHRWLAALLPLMDGEHTVEELCQGLAPGQRATVTGLISRLLERGIVADRPPEPCDLPDRVGSHFRRQIEFIAHYADRPRHRFLGFRSSSVLLVGAGDAFVAALTGLINNGLERVAVSGGESSWRSWPGVDGALDRLRSAGVGPAVREVDADDVRLGSFDLVLHCSDGGDPRQVLRLLERCWSEGTAFLPMSCAVQRMVVGPLTVPSGSPCWMCSRSRLSDAAG